jgi:hypothetical protein
MDGEETRNPDAIHAGRHRMGWETDEFVSHQRSRLWYVGMALLGAVLIVYAVATANFLFAVILLMGGIIMLVSSFSPPERVPIVITTLGIVVGDEFYEYKGIKDFSIAYQPPEVKLLYVAFHSVWLPLLAIPLEDEDPNAVRAILLDYVPENLGRTEERLTDTVKRMYKL